MFLIKRTASILLVSILSLMITACNYTSIGGGSGTNLSGTAATGAPIAGNVFAKDANGTEVKVASGVNGSFTLNTTGMTPPFLLKIVPADGSPALYSYALANGQTVNITSLTNLALFLASKKGDLASLYSSWNGTAITASAISQAAQTVVANFKSKLTAAGINPTNYDVLTAQFNADGTGIDGVMDNLVVAIDPANASFTVKDNNNATVVFNENIDITAPVVTAPQNLTVTATGTTGIAATDATIAAFLNGATATDNVGVVGGVTNDAPTTFSVGVTTVTFTAKDAAGNTGTAQATVTVKPLVVNPTQFTVSAAVSGLGANQGVTLLSGSDALQFTTNGTRTFATKINSGSTYSVSVRSTSTGISCAVNPATGTATTNVTVQVACSSTAIPTITATSPTNNAVFTAASNGLADVQINVSISNYNLANGAWNMIVDGVAPSGGIFSTSLLKSFAVGSHTVVFQLTGPGKAYTPLTNQQKDTIKFQVKAATTPVVTAPSNISVVATNAAGIAATDATVAAFLNGATATNNVGVVVNDAPATFSVGVTTVTFTAKDAAGNSGTAQATVTVTAPVTQYVIKGTITGSSSWELRTNNNAFVNDGISQSGNVTFGSINDGATYAVTPTTTGCTVTNGTGTVNGADVTNVVITCGSSDTTPPVVTPPADLIINSTVQVFASNAAVQTFLSGATATDNVDGNLTASITNDLILGIFQPGTSTAVKFSVTDAAGNTGSVIAKIIIDNAPPVVTAPKSIVVTKTSSAGIAKTDAVIAAFLNAVTATDQSGIVGAITNDAPATLSIGSTVITFTAKDNAGRVGTATSIINVYDPAAVTATPTNFKITSKAKKLKFSWDAANAHHYNLLHNPDGVSGFSLVATNIRSLEYNQKIAVHQIDWTKVQYMIEACDANESNCIQSGALSLTPALQRSATIYVKAFNPKASTTTPAVTQNSYFGSDVAITGDGLTMAVGSKGSGTRGAVSGVYIYKKNVTTDTWAYDTFFTPPNADLRVDEFGASVSISDDGKTIAVGAPSEGSNATGINGNEADNSVTVSGAVYIFTNTTGSWTQQAYIKADTANRNSYFGATVSLSKDGNTLLTTKSLASGALEVFIFERTNGSWSQKLKAVPSTFTNALSINTQAALSKDGMTFAFSTGKSDSIYIYTKQAATGAWTQQAALTVTGAVPKNKFGNSSIRIDKNSLSADGNTLVVSGQNSTSGIAESYIFNRTGTSWAQGSTLSLEATASFRIYKVIISPDGTFIASGDTKNNAGGGVKASAMKIFELKNTSWNQVSAVDPSINTFISGIGWSVPVLTPNEFGGTNNALVAGVPLENARSAGGVDQPVLSSSTRKSGAVFVY